jgi:hypothetical protein
MGVYVWIVNELWIVNEQRPERGERDWIVGTKKSGLRMVTLIATPNPVSQVLW